MGGVTDDVDLAALLDEEHRGSPWAPALLLSLSLWLVWLSPLWIRVGFGPLEESLKGSGSAFSSVCSQAAVITRGS
jgi:hypothetical protein